MSLPDEPHAGRRRAGRAPDALRPVTLSPGWAPYAEGSCLVTAGETRVLCTASVDEELPAWREGDEAGWVTAEYSMLPRATHSRTRRERGPLRGRTQEIQRLIGRSLRAVVDLQVLGPRTVILDCDVLQADGGTRTAAITGAWVALSGACARLQAEGRLDSDPILGPAAAVSVGVVGGEPLLDLDYREDSAAEVDLNVVATGGGEIIEVQGTAEGAPFSVERLHGLVDLALAGIRELSAAQEAAVREEG